MATIETIVRSINRDLTPQFEERLRAILAEHDREWLIDQIVRLTLDAHSLEEIDRRSEVEAKARARSERLDRVRALGLDRAALQSFLAAYGGSPATRSPTRVRCGPTYQPRAGTCCGRRTGPNPARHSCGSPRMSCSRCSSETRPPPPPSSASSRSS